MNRRIIKRFIVIFIIIILAIISILIIYKNSNKVYIKNYSYTKFTLNTKFKYRIEIKSNIVNFTELPMIADQIRYYEVNLKNNVVELREDLLPTKFYYEKAKHTENIDFYTRKLIYKKNITDEESNQLKELLEKVIREGQTTSHSGSYYSISNKYISNIIMENKEDIMLFLNIVKNNLE